MKLPLNMNAFVKSLVGGFVLFSGLSTVADGIAITNVTVHTLTGQQPLSGATIVIADGRIAAMGAAVDIPQNAQRIDGQGAVVTPGLFESYSQIGLEEIPLEASTQDGVLSDGSHGPSFDVQYAINPKSAAVAVNRAEGVTHVVVAPHTGPDPLAGLGAVTRLTDTQSLLVPQVAMFGSFNADIAAKVGGSRAEIINRLRRALAELPRFSKSRYKALNGQYPLYDMVALDKAVEDNLPFVIDVHRANDILTLLSLADDYDLRLVVRGGTEAWQVANELVAANVPVILDPLNNLPVNFERLGARLDNAAMLHAAGVKIAVSVTDSHNARLLRQHAGNAVAEGLPWQEGLRAITRSPVEIYDLDDDLGKIQVGGPASLVVWTGDPLELSSWATHVVIDGELQSETTRQTRLLERYQDLEAGKKTRFGYQ